MLRPSWVVAYGVDLLLRCASDDLQYSSSLDSLVDASFSLLNYYVRVKYSMVGNNELRVGVRAAEVAVGGYVV